MSLSLIIAIILIGLILVVLEILFLPGFIAGLIGGLMIFIGIYFSYSISTVVGNYTLVGSIILLVLFIYFSFRSKTWLNMSLKTEVDGKMNVVEEGAVKVGDTGTSISRLAPVGKAQINGDYYEVRSNGEFINENTEISVLKVSGNVIIVKPN